MLFNLASTLILSIVVGEAQAGKPKVAKSGVMTEVDVDRLVGALQLLTNSLNDSAAKLHAAVDRLEGLAQQQTDSQQTKGSPSTVEPELDITAGSQIIASHHMQFRNILPTRAHTTSGIIRSDLMSPPAPTFQDDKDPFDNIFQPLPLAEDIRQRDQYNKKDNK